MVTTVWNVAKKALSVLDLHLDILSLTPPPKAMVFDFAKMVNNIKRGIFELDWHGKDGGFYEAAIFDFIGAMPLLRSDRPVAKAEWLKLGDSFYGGVYKDLIDAISLVFRKKGDSAIILSATAFELGEVLQEVITKFSNGLAYAKESAETWVKEADAQETAIDKLASKDEIANSMLEAHVRFACGDFGYFAGQNERLVNFLPALLAKSHNFIQQLYAHTLHVAKTVFKEAGLDEFEILNSFIESGGLGCMDYCYTAMEKFEIEKGGPSLSPVFAKRPGMKASSGFRFQEKLLGPSTQQVRGKKRNADVPPKEENVDYGTLEQSGMETAGNRVRTDIAVLAQQLKGKEDF